MNDAPEAYQRSDLYAGKPDERQSQAAAVAPEHSLFRKRYRALQVDEVRLHDAIKDKADELAKLIAALNPSAAQKLIKLSIDDIEKLCPRRLGEDGVHHEIPVYDGACVILALRHLEDAVYRAVKALTS